MSKTDDLICSLSNGAGVILDSLGKILGDYIRMNPILKGEMLDAIEPV